MKIDSHQHFWRYSAAEFGWISDAMQAIRRDFSPADLAKAFAPTGFNGAVAVQARQLVEETRWLLQLAKENALIKGVVGWVPLAEKNIPAALDEFAADKNLKGVRHVVQAEADPAFLDRAAFNAGIREVTARKLVYDILIVARQLPASIRFVDRHPDQVFVLDHIAKPVVQGAPDATWAANILELAKRERVYCKFSGVITEAPGWKWTQELIQQYFDVVLEAFGPRRLMFGSDWPVCTVGLEHAAWVQCVEKCAAKLSTDERARLFGGTASEAYRLNS